jgi:hypothetical protein
MNPRIRELCIQSGAWEHYEVNEGVEGDDLPMQRFAELIVQECAGIIESQDVDPAFRHRMTWAMKEHFGVEE